MTKYNVGDKVRILGKSVFDADHIGKITEIEITEVQLYCGGYGYAVPFDGMRFLYTEDNLELVNDKLSKKQRISALESKVAELEAKFEALREALQ